MVKSLLTSTNGGSMKKMLFSFACIIVAVTLSLTGCEWTSGGGVESWDSSKNYVDVSGVYRAADNAVLVREFGDSSSSEYASEKLARC